MDYEQLIYDWIQKHYPKGIEIYADYRDEISAETVQELLNAPYDSYTAFWEWLDEAYLETMDDAQHDAFSDMMDDLEILDEAQYDFKDEFFDYFRDNCPCNPPTDHFLSQSFCCDVFIDSGNWSYDCTCEDYGNNYYATLYKNDKISDIQDESSILWLARKQGYSKLKLYSYIYKRNYAKKHPSKFLRSVNQELANITSNMNTLVFATTFTLEELLRLHTDDKNEPLKISKTTSCGLFDPFNGGGSVLEIELEKDIVIDRKWVRGIYLDDAIRRASPLCYGIDDVYGMLDSFWERG